MDKELEEQALTPIQLKDLMINVHATFGRWTELLRYLVKHCNDLLHLNIGASPTQAQSYNCGKASSRAISGVKGAPSKILD